MEIMESIPGGSGSVSLEEQETTISYCRTEAAVSVWTSDRTVMTKLDRLCREAPDNYQCVEIGRDQSGCMMSKEYQIADKGLLSFRKNRNTVTLTDEQKAERAERLRRSTMAKVAE